MRTYSLVVVDDNAEYRAILLDLLARMPGLLVTATGGSDREAVQLCVRHAPDIVLLDAGMPSYGALTAASDIRDILPETHIVFMTTTERDSYGIVQRMTPADSVISKSSIKEGMYGILRLLSGSPG